MSHTQNICFYSFDLFCPLLEKDTFIENLYIVLSCTIKQRSFQTLFVLIPNVVLSCWGVSKHSFMHQPIHAPTTHHASDVAQAVSDPGYLNGERHNYREINGRDLPHIQPSCVAATHIGVPPVGCPQIPGNLPLSRASLTRPGYKDNSLVHRDDLIGEIPMGIKQQHFCTFHKMDK